MMCNLFLSEKEPKMKTWTREDSIFVEALQSIWAFSGWPNFNYFDPIENQYIERSLTLKVHLTCMNQINNLPRQIEKKDRNIRFGKEYFNLFRKKKTKLRKSRWLQSLSGN